MAIQWPRSDQPGADSLRRERLNERDVEAMLRQEASLERDRWAEVALALVEPEGKLAVKRHEWAQEAQKKDTGQLRKEE